MSKRVIILFAILAVGAGAVPGAAERPAPPGDRAYQDIPIVESTLLERLGFAPDATGVYATPRAYDELLRDAEDRKTSGQARPADRLDGAEESGGPYGPLASGFSAVSGYGIRPRTSETQHTTFGFGERYCISGSPFFDVLLDALPHGVLLTDFEVHYFDNSPEDLEVTLWEITASGQAAPTATMLAVIESFGNPGYLPEVADVDRRVNVSSSTYLVRVRLDDDFDTSCSEDNNLAIVGVRAVWKRDVSSPPLTATFDDVPTSHPFFQHIEALVASGITTGCDDDSYCPSGPLTRGQMAVFLAKALGLHWPAF